MAAATAVVPDVDIKALIRGSKRATDTVRICLRGDLVAQFEALDAELAEVAGTVHDSRLNGAAARGRRIAEQMQALQELMRASTVPFVLRALRPKRWAELSAEHPPRKGDDGKVLADDLMGVNSATFFVPLIRESVITPALDDDDWAALLGDDRQEEDSDGDGGLSDAQLDSLARAAWRLNRNDIDIPFSRAASAILRSIGVE